MSQHGLCLTLLCGGDPHRDPLHSCLLAPQDPPPLSTLHHICSCHGDQWLPSSCGVSCAVKICICNICKVYGYSQVWLSVLSTKKLLLSTRTQESTRQKFKILSNYYQNIKTVGEELQQNLTYFPHQNTQCKVLLYIVFPFEACISMHIFPLYSSTPTHFRALFCIVMSSSLHNKNNKHYKNVFMSPSSSGGFLHTRGYDPVLAVLLFSGALALHSRQLDLKLRLDYLWATQVCGCWYIQHPVLASRVQF